MNIFKLNGLPSPENPYVSFLVGKFCTAYSRAINLIHTSLDGESNSCSTVILWTAGPSLWNAFSRCLVSSFCIRTTSSCREVGFFRCCDILSLRVDILSHVRSFFYFLGNHESETMNQMYGFDGEVKSKYPFLRLPYVLCGGCGVLLVSM